MKMNQCMTCRIDKTSEFKINRLKELLRNIEPDREFTHRQRYNWSLNSRCKYGMRCDELHSMNTKLERIIDEIEPKLSTVIKTQNDNLYHECLRCMTATFSNVYHNFERDYRSFNK